MFKANIITCAVLTFLGMLVFLVPTARADGVYTYSYTGNPFTTVGGTITCPPACSISGSFSVPSQLPANDSNFVISNYGSPSLYPYSFTSGDITITGTNGGSGLVSVSTDSNGSIVSWDVDLSRGLSGVGYFQIFSQPPGDTFTEHNIGGYLAGVGSNSASPGTWILTSPVSEPSAAALLACGILVLVGLSFRTFLVRVAGIEEFRFREGRLGARILLR